MGELDDLLSGETTPQEHADREMFIEAILDSMAETSYHSVSDASELEIGGAMKFVSAGLSLDVSEGAIVEENLTTGAFTVHTQVTEGSSGSLGVALLGNVHGGDDASYTLSVGFGPDGTPTEVAVSESYTIADGAQLTFDPSTLADLPAAIQTAVGVSSGGSDVDHLELRASVALDDASDRAVLDSYLADPETGGDGLYELLDRRGELLMQRYDGTETSEGASVGVGLLANLAAESGRTARELTLTDAWSWDPANGGLHCSDCLD